MTEDLKRESPMLDAIPRRDPFVVPDRYFERFPHLVQSRIAEPEPAWRRLLAGFWNAHWAIRAAIPVAAALAIIFLLRVQDPADSAQAAFTTDIKPEELADWSMNDEDLFAVLPDEEQTSVWAEPLSEEELTGYMDHEGIPLELIIEEL